MNLNPGANRRRMVGACLQVGLGVTFCLALYVNGRAQGTPPTQPSQSSGGATSSTGKIDRALLDRYCVTCHNDRLKTAELSLTGVDPGNVETAPEIWEKVALKLRTASMPPPGRPQPEKAAVNAFVT